LKAENARVAQTQLSLQEQFEAVQQIVDLAQNSSSLGHVLMSHWHQADKFRLDVAELASSRDIGEDVIRRAEYAELVSRLLHTSVENQLDPSADEAVLTVAKDYVRTQRQLLAELIAIQTELINIQGSIDRTHQQLDVKYDAYQRYLSSRILWVPSHPAISFSLLKNFRQKFSALVDKLADLRMTRFTPISSLLLLLAVVSFALRRKMSLHLQSLNAKVGRARDDSIAYTFRALLLTLTRSVPLPLLLFIIAAGLEKSSASAAPYLEKSLFRAAEFLFLLLLFRVTCEENGLAHVHFGWTRSACMGIHRLTTSLLVWWWPLVLLTALLVRVELDSISAVFGRLAFCLNMAIFGVIFFKFIRSEKQAVNAYRRWWLIGAGIVALTVFFLIAFSILGYVYSASIIYSALNTSVVMVAGLAFFYYFMQRWLLVVRRRLRFREILAARQTPEDEQEQTAESDEVDLVTLSASVSRLLTAATLALGALGFAYVWAPLFQALEAMQRITLWTVSDVAEGEAILTSITLASLLLALLIGVVTIIASRNLPQLYSLLLRSRQSSTPGSRYAISKLLGYFIIGAGFIVILSTLGLRWDRLQWLVAALSVGIGFGLQEIIANFISGLIILFERPIRVGDVLTVGESSGTVIRIQIRATTIRDFDGKELLVPNKEFVTGRLLNWTLSNTDIRMTLDVGIAYGSDVRKAVAILEDLLAKHEMVLDTPAPDVLFREFGNSSLNLVARYFFSDVDQRGYLLSDLHHKINDAFKEAGIVIAFPQIDVHLDKPKAEPVNLEDPIPSGG
jgi:potassium efflux system protein